MKNFPRAWLEKDREKHTVLEQIVQPNVKCASTNTSNQRITDRSDQFDFIYELN